MYVLVRMRYIHAFRLVPSWKPPKPRNARRYVSWTRSSASAGLRVMRRAPEYSELMSGIACSVNVAWSAMTRNLAAVPAEVFLGTDRRQRSVVDGTLCGA